MRKRFRCFICLLCLTAFVVCGCVKETPEKAAERYSATFFGAFDTAVQLIGYAESEAVFQARADETREEFLRLHRLFDIYNEYEGITNLYIVNRDAGKSPVRVPDEIFELLAFCKETQPALMNKTNIALGAVLSLWHDYRDAGTVNPGDAELPPMTLLEAAAAHCDMNDVILDAQNKTVFFNDPELLLDVGAVAKGYAAERAARMLLASDMPSFILSAGGNVRAGDKPLDGRLRWGVSVQDPDGASDTDANTDIMDTLYFTNLSAVTSGDYQRYYVVDGIRYHHLISPDTLMPATYVRSVTVVTEDSGYADMLSTALFLMPYEEARALADTLQVDVYWVLNDRSVRMTDGMAGMAKSMGASSK